jgi:hypothetical protein
MNLTKRAAWTWRKGFDANSSTEGRLPRARGVAIAACLALLAQQGQPAERRVNVVASAIHGISSGEAGDAVLVVFVVDDAGDPMDEVGVVVTDYGKAIDAGTTDAHGKVVFRVPTARVVSVRAADTGFVPGVAHGVELRSGFLTALALPLEEAGAHE